MKSIMLIAFVVPALALVTGYQSTPVPSPQIVIEKQVLEHEIPVVKPKELFVVEHYKFPESHIVITVNQFPFDMAGNRPYEIAVQGVKYRFKPEDVEEFLKKGVSLNVESKKLPTGTFAKRPFEFAPGEVPKL
jgi:hypothetical protein